MTLRKNDEKDPKKKFADYVWNLTQVEAEFQTLRSLIVTDAIGTWTPGVSFGGGVTGITYSATNGGLWTRHGGLVHVVGLLRLTNKGSDVGSALLTGLPFAVKNSDAAMAVASVAISAITYANQWECLGLPGTQTATFVEVTEAGDTSYLTNADFTNTSRVRISMTYMI